MARSPKDDPRYNAMQHHAWNYRAETVENCAANKMNERNQPVLLSNVNVMKDNMYGNSNSYSPNDVYMNNHSFNPNASTGDNTVNNDDNISHSTGHQNNVQNYAMLKLGNGQLVRVYYDENNQRLMIPVTGQYELFSHNQGLLDMPLQSPPLSHMFSLNQDYSLNENNNLQTMQLTTNSPNNIFNKENLKSQPASPPTSNFLKEVLGNWEPNSSGTYSPFGQNYPLNHPDAPAMNLMQNLPQVLDPQLHTNMCKPEHSSPKRNEPMVETVNKKRIVAEVKPMRPTYSDVLAKNTKNNSQTEPIRKTKTSNNIETKSANKLNNIKTEKISSNTKNIYDENKQKNDSRKPQMTSSGSESGDINSDDREKRQKTNKKTKNKRNNMSRKWSSLDDMSKEEESNYNSGGNDSQFIFIENQAEKPTKKEKKCNENKTKNTEHKNSLSENNFKIDADHEDSQFVIHDGQTDGSKSRRKKEGRPYGHKPSKPAQDKKKVVQSKWRRNKPGYLGMAHSYLEHWGGATWKAVVWFLYLLSDICGMSAHLTFDLCTSVFTQTYVSSQTVWRSTKEWICKLGDNKYLIYIDRKLGHTRFGFWRKLKWYKKETDNGAETKLNANIPMPATGEEAMKRLLACKGKDPYSILGVSVNCTDEEIKRYYRRQAFLVHPDKNQQPGAEEAFKILQHAFDLIGEPERRESYDRRAVESRHVEAAWSELSQLLAQLHDKMEFAANTIRCTNCGRRHKRVLTERPCYAARYCSQCKIRHSAKEGDIWAESSMMGLLVMYYACMDGAVYQITQWASCQKKNLKQLRPDCHVVQYRIVLGNKAAAAADVNQRPSAGHDPNLEEFLNNLYSKSGAPSNAPNTKQPSADPSDAKKRRNKKLRP